MSWEKSSSSGTSSSSSKPFISSSSWSGPMQMSWEENAKGTSYVPRTGPAIVHEGERIIRKNDNGSRGNISITVNVRALDPIGMAQVVEREIMPRVEEAKRRVWA